MDNQTWTREGTSNIDVQTWTREGTSSMDNQTCTRKGTSNMDVQTWTRERASNMDAQTWTREGTSNMDAQTCTRKGTNQYYSTGVQIVSCTLSDDSVLSESTGLCNPVLCVSQWNLFWQKNQSIRLCLSNQVRPGREWFLSPLGDFNRLFEGLIGELFKIWHWNMFYFFKWHQSGP